VTLNTAEESLRQGWKETITGDIHSIDSLWNGIE